MAEPGTLLHELEVALNEAERHNARVRTDTAEVMLDFRVLTLPEVGPEPSPRERVLRLRLTEVGRVAASLRNGLWNDKTAAVVPFALETSMKSSTASDRSPFTGGTSLTRMMTPGSNGGIVRASMSG
jgi:hypothetical protein